MNVTAYGLATDRSTSNQIKKFSLLPLLPSTRTELLIKISYNLDHAQYLQDMDSDILSKSFIFK
jgi:hypothetical protein